MRAVVLDRDRLPGLEVARGEVDLAGGGVLLECRRRQAVDRQRRRRRVVRNRDEAVPLAGDVGREVGRVVDRVGVGGAGERSARGLDPRPEPLGRADQGAYRVVDATRRHALGRAVRRRARVAGVGAAVGRGAELGHGRSPVGLTLAAVLRALQPASISPVGREHRERIDQSPRRCRRPSEKSLLGHPVFGGGRAPQ